MAVDTFAKRMAVGGVPASMVGPNVFPGTTGTSAGRGAAAWNYLSGAPAPSAESPLGHLGIGQKRTFTFGGDAMILGGGGWG